MRKSISEKRKQVDASLQKRGLLSKVERFWASKKAQAVLTKGFEDNLEALYRVRESVNKVHECYFLAGKLVYDAKAGEGASYKDAVSAVFRFDLDEAVNKLARFMPVDSVLPILADESQNEQLWLESLRTACETISGFVHKDFCEKLLAVGMPASQTKKDMAQLILVLTGEQLDEDELNHLWLQNVIMHGSTGVLR